MVERGRRGSPQRVGMSQDAGGRRLHVESPTRGPTQEMSEMTSTSTFRIPRADLTGAYAGVRPLISTVLGFSMWKCTSPEALVAV